MPTISDRLVEGRKTLGLSQQALADHVGISARSQRNYESGERSPDADYLAVLAALGLDVVYILTGQHADGFKPRRALTADEETMLVYYRDASPAVRKAAMAALLSASPSAAAGGDFSQHSRGDGVIQIGGSGGNVKIKKK